MNITIEMLAPWSVAVYVDGEISDCFDCADAAVEHVRELTSSTTNVAVTFGEGWAQACDKAERRGWKNEPYGG